MGSPCLGVLDEVLEGQGSVQHHRLLGGQHLVVYGVVEMSHLIVVQRGGGGGKGGEMGERKHYHRLY